MAPTSFTYYFSPQNWSVNGYIWSRPDVNEPAERAFAGQVQPVACIGTRGSAQRGHLPAISPGNPKDPSLLEKGDSLLCDSLCPIFTSTDVKLPLFLISVFYFALVVVTGNIGSVVTADIGLPSPRSKQSPPVSIPGFTCW